MKNPGGQENVKEFISEKENRAGVIYPSLPESFDTLHTKWGSLNLDINDQKFKEARGLFADVLQSAESRGVYSKIIYSEVEDYVTMRSSCNSVNLACKVSRSSSNLRSSRLCDLI